MSSRDRSNRTRHGVVTAFDDPKGLGTITDEDGHTHLFHCTQIADGTRTIAVGQAVRFELLPKLGRYEAIAIETRTLEQG